MIASSPRTKTSVGQPASSPPAPKPTGTGVLEASGLRRTTPASTSPMNAMNRPMPTLIAVFSPVGTAWNTALRKPVRTSTRMISPSMTTRPMASAQLICEAIENATKAFSPRPVARASGKFATTPIRIVTTPGHQGRGRGHQREVGCRAAAEELPVDVRHGADDQGVEHHDVGHREERDEPPADLPGRRSSRARRCGRSCPGPPPLPPVRGAAVWVPEPDMANLSGAGG